MIDQINKLIAINLFLLFVSEDNSLPLKEFADEQGNQLPGAKMLANIMLQKTLIKPSTTKEFYYELTELGIQISESGGWLTHLEKTKVNQNQSRQNKTFKIKTELIVAGVIILFLSFLIVSCM